MSNRSQKYIFSDSDFINDNQQDETIYIDHYIKPIVREEGLILKYREVIKQTRDQAYRC